MTRINILKGSYQSSNLWSQSYTICGSVKLKRLLPKGVTAATALTACWAAVVASYNRQNDVVFGRVVAGRAGSTNPNISNVVGPCLNIVPVRAFAGKRKHRPHGVPARFLQAFNSSR